MDMSVMARQKDTSKDVKFFLLKDAQRRAKPSSVSSIAAHWGGGV
jgi:hypothetical protein